MDIKKVLNKNNKMKKLIVAMLVFFSIIKLNAQVIEIPAKHIFLWAEMGSGASTRGISSNLSLNLNILHSDIFTLQLAGRDEIRWEGNESSSGINFLYGKIYKGKAGFISASAGLSYLIGNLRGVATSYEGSAGAYKVYDMIPYSVMGLAMEQQAFLTRKKGLGIGIEALENLNSINTSAEIMLCIAIGGFR
jgi:hypothetical protein